MWSGLWSLIVVGALVLLFLLKWIYVLKEYERGVVFRLGRVLRVPKGPGFLLVFWPIDRIVVVSLRTVVHDIPPQDVITRDNVSVRVSAVVYFRVVEPIRSIIAVQRYENATSQLGQTTLRSVIGQAELDEVLAERERLNRRIQAIIDHQSNLWGIQIALVEIKHVDLPQEMQRAMARQAEAEREKRAKIIHAEGEYVAAERLADAAQVMQREPTALHLRYLQTLTEIAAERNSTILFPLPLDLLRPFLEKALSPPHREEPPRREGRRMPPSAEAQPR
jgi:regulator of protease activity HflC (stomatin/prohibitin superfamily)